MSYVDQHGVQLHPDQLPAPIVVRFDHGTAHTSVETMGARLGLDADQVTDTLRALVECGFLVHLEDGSYLADMDTAAEL